MNWIPLLGKEKTFDAAAAWFFSLDVDGSRVTNTNGKIMFQTLSLLSEVHNNFLGKRCEGGQLDYSHRFRAESMSILFSIFFKTVEDCKKFLDDCLDGRPQIDDVED